MLLLLLLVFLVVGIVGIVCVPCVYHVCTVCIVCIVCIMCLYRVTCLTLLVSSPYTTTTTTHCTTGKEELESGYECLNLFHDLVYRIPYVVASTVVIHRSKGRIRSIVGYTRKDRCCTRNCLACAKIVVYTILLVVSIKVTRAR